VSATVNMTLTPAAALVTLVLLASCQSAPQPPAAGVPPVAPGEVAPSGPIERCYHLDPAASEIRILVYKDGPLARLGHNHVLTGNGLDARLAVRGPGGGNAMRLRFAVASLTVDPPAARGEEGADFESVVSDKAREDTHTNLLGPAVLDAAEHPYIDAELASSIGPAWAPDATLRIVLLGQQRVISVSPGVITTGEALIVQGSFAVQQTALGMEPFSVLGGGLKVADELRVRVRLVFVASTERDLAGCMVPFDALSPRAVAG
jgi:hypothetical protein